MATVLVKNISPNTEEKEIKDFLSFCGKITDLKVTSEGETKSATVTFEKPTAAKTALLLNNTKLGQSEISVTSDADLGDDAGQYSSEKDSHTLEQEEKPKARIVAELLANGYLIGNTTLEKALALDEKHGISQRFLKTLQSFDSKYHATDRAKAADQSYGITQRATGLWAGFSTYYEKATNTPTGKKIVDFYSAGQRQVTDIHNEAKRLAELKTQEAGGSSHNASILSKVLGPEKTTQSGDAPGAAPSNATATESQQQPTAPANVPGNNASEKIV